MIFFFIYFLFISLTLLVTCLFVYSVHSFPPFWQTVEILWIFIFKFRNSPKMLLQRFTVIKFSRRCDDKNYILTITWTIRWRCNTYGGKADSNSTNAEKQCTTTELTEHELNRLFTCQCLALPTHTVLNLIKLSNWVIRMCLGKIVSMCAHHKQPNFLF